MTEKVEQASTIWQGKRLLAWHVYASDGHRYRVWSETKSDAIAKVQRAGHVVEKVEPAGYTI